MHVPPPHMKNIKELKKNFENHKDGKITLKEFTPLFYRLLNNEGYLM